MKISEFLKCNYVLRQELSHFAFCYSLCRALLVLAEYNHPYFSFAPRNFCYIITSEAERGRRRQHNP